MLLRRSLTMIILFVLAIASISGCSTKAKGNIDVPKTSALLFDGDRSATLATQIGRYEWPTTDGPVETIEDTVYVEYYRDMTGSAGWERSTPRRQFRSYRTGSRYR